MFRQRRTSVETSKDNSDRFLCAFVLRSENGPRRTSGNVADIRSAMQSTTFSINVTNSDDISNTCSIDQTRGQESDYAVVLVALIYLILSFSGAVMQLLVLVIVWRLRRASTRFATVYYALLINLYAANLALQLLYVFYVTPVIFAVGHRRPVGLDEMAGGLETTLFVTVVGSTFLIAVERAWTLGRHTSGVAGRRVWPVCLSTWILGIIAVAMDAGQLACWTLFLDGQFSFAIVCNDDQPPAESFSSIVVYVGVYGVAVFYTYALWKLIWQHRHVEGDWVREKLKRYQRRLLFQALVIWLFLLADVIAFRLIPGIQSNFGAGMTTAVVVLGQSMVPPVCLVFFSKDVRRTAMQMLASYNDKIKIQAVSKKCDQHEKRTPLPSNPGAIRTILIKSQL